MYGIEVCYPSALVARQELERVHRLMARYLCNDYSSAYGDFLMKLKWCPIWRRVLELQLRLFHKLCHVSHFDFLLPRVQGIVRSSSRNSHPLSISLHARKSTVSNLFFFRVSKLWNSLPFSAVNTSYNCFRSFLKTDRFLSILRGSTNSVNEVLLPRVEIR